MTLSPHTIVVYYFDELETKKLVKDLLPRSREIGVDENLRGWNWDKSPLRPYTEKILMPAWEVSLQECETNRDVWLRRTLGKRLVFSASQMEGILIHRIVSRLFSYAKKLLFSGERDVLEALVNYGKQMVSKELHQRGEEIRAYSLNAEELRRKAEQLLEWEALCIQHKVSDVLARYPFVNEESLVAMAVPFFTELLLDGRFLGLSERLRVDAASSLDVIVFDVKTSRPSEDHRLQLAGYALVMEAIFERPINVGCVVYVGFDPLRVKRELFLIADKLRAKFLELRDEKQKLLLEGEEPRVAESCPKYCAFYSVCH